MLKFEASKKQYDDFVIWETEHNKVCKYADPMKQGEIGGRFTFSFAPTTIGTVFRVECTCSEKIDLSDYSDW